MLHEPACYGFLFRTLLRWARVSFDPGVWLRLVGPWFVCLTRMIALGAFFFAAAHAAFFFRRNSSSLAALRSFRLGWYV